jgi:hypothetical protein
LLDHLASLLIVETNPFSSNLLKDERLEKLDRHFLGKTALVQFKRGTHHDHRTAGVIDAFTEQVLTETTLLAFEHVRERTQRTFVGAREGLSATAVVEERIDRFLQACAFRCA